VIGLQWLWLEAAHRIVVRTIPYSEFKELLAQGRVISAAVGESEITGEIRGAPPVENPPNTGQKNAATSSKPAAAASAGSTTNQKPGEKQSSASASPAGKTNKALAKPPSFLFRTNSLPTRTRG
jgi:hypothetical protein